MEKSKDDKTISPLYETNPIFLGEEISESAEDLAVKLAKKWVEENRL